VTCTFVAHDADMEGVGKAVRIQCGIVKLLWRDGIIDLPKDHSTRQLGWRFRYVGQGVVMRVAWVSTCIRTVCLLVDMYWCADYMAVMN
jgi:hypothetical protein